MRRSRSFLPFCLCLCLMLLGCVTQFDVRDRPPLPVPDLQSLTATEALGYEIYLRDQAAWHATDVALEAGLQETPAEGWITLLTVDGSIVRFVGTCESGPCSYLDVESFDPDAPAIVTVHDGIPLPEEQAARWRARQLAGSTDFRACTERYNTVVTKAEHRGAPAWRVYLLASSQDPGEVVLTGHHRITISGDGREVLLEEPLSKSCLFSRPEAETVSLVVSHILDPEPIETHVFTSLDYRIPIMVVSEKGIFRVEGAKIRLVERR